MEGISIHNLSYEYEGDLLLNNVSYQFPVNKMTGLLAVSDYDLSGLLKALGGIFEPRTGTVIVDGIDITKGGLIELQPVRKKMAFVFENRGLLSNLSVMENILLPYNYHFPSLSLEEKKEAIIRLCRKFNVNERWLGERPARISPLINKLVLLIRAYVTTPAYIFYDLPLQDLDMKAKKIVIEYMLELRESGVVTQIFIANTDILYGLADHNVVFSGGEIIESGAWEDLIQSGHPVVQRIIKEYLEIGIDEAQI